MHYRQGHKHTRFFGRPSNHARFGGTVLASVSSTEALLGEEILNRPRSFEGGPFFAAGRSGGSGSANRCR
jgi:hypothetical protein